MWRGVAWTPQNLCWGWWHAVHSVAIGGGATTAAPRRRGLHSPTSISAHFLPPLQGLLAFCGTHTVYDRHHSALVSDCACSEASRNAALAMPYATGAAGLKPRRTRPLCAPADCCHPQRQRLAPLMPQIASGGLCRHGRGTCILRGALRGRSSTGTARRKPVPWHGRCMYACMHEPPVRRVLVWTGVTPVPCYDGLGTWPRWVAHPSTCEPRAGARQIGIANSVIFIHAGAGWLNPDIQKIRI
ncbi:hypothetical protein ANO11243_026760 [Dothideomycetidae sp. 11243]|nr:hypothetical protein ANO11243_026760 [fungal sp. No.11243]